MSDEYPEVGMPYAYSVIPRAMKRLSVVVRSAIHVPFVNIPDRRGKLTNNVSVMNRIEEVKQGRVLIDLPSGTR